MLHNFKKYLSFLYSDQYWCLVLVELVNIYDSIYLKWVIVKRPKIDHAFESCKSVN